MPILHVKNLAEVRKKFKLLYGKNLKSAEARAMNKVVLSAATYIKGEMSKVPVKHDSKGRIIAGGSKPFGFPSVVTGNLKGNIVGRVIEEGGKVVGLVGSFKEEIGKNPYDIFLEFGTGSRGAEGRGTIDIDIYGKEFVQGLSYKTNKPGMYRRPFLQPAVTGAPMMKLNKIYQAEITKGTDTRI